jgi:hypothetical protein
VATFASELSAVFGVGGMSALTAAGAGEEGSVVFEVVGGGVIVEVAFGFGTAFAVAGILSVDSLFGWLLELGLDAASGDVCACVSGSVLGPSAADVMFPMPASVATGSFTSAALANRRPSVAEESPFGI